MGASAVHVVFAAGGVDWGGGPQREAFRGGAENLDVAAVALALAGPPQVHSDAGGAGYTAAIGLDEGAVEHYVRVTGCFRALDGLLQRRGGLGVEDGDPLQDVVTDRFRARPASPPARLLDRCHRTSGRHHSGQLLLSCNAHRASLLVAVNSSVTAVRLESVPSIKKVPTGGLRNSRARRRDIANITASRNPRACSRS